MWPVQLIHMSLKIPPFLQTRLFTQGETYICSRYLNRQQHFFSQNFREYEQLTEIPPNAKDMRVYLSCSSFNNRVHCQSWSCWADAIQWSRVQYVHQRDPWCALLSDGRARRAVHLSLWVLATITSWTRAADVQKNLGFAHWRWNASPISRWNWKGCESAAPSCPVLILNTCICIWVACSCVYMYIWYINTKSSRHCAYGPTTKSWNIR